MPQVRSPILLFAALIVFSVSAAAGHAQHSPSEVLLVSNANSPISTAVADDYAEQRRVANRVVVKCADSALTRANETISFGDYKEEIADPVSAYLGTHKNINFIVLTKGIPVRISGGPTGAGMSGPLQASLDSTLASLDYATIPGAVKASLRGSGMVGTAWINRYYNSSVSFSHAEFGGYLVTRLDGYTQADAMGLVRQSLAAGRTQRPEKVLFDIEPDFGLGDKTAPPLRRPAATVIFEAAWSRWNADMLHISDILEASGVPHETSVTRQFVGDRSDLLGYFSWGSNDSRFHSEAYASLRFAPGSLGDTAVSTSARTFLPTTFGQTLIADLIAHGLTCCQGYVNEPLLDGTSSPTIDLTHYLVGFTMAESLYAGTPYIGWEGVCVGDPLCCPYIGGKLVVPRPASRFNGWSGGVHTEACREGGLDLGNVSNGDDTAYDDIDLTGASRFSARIAGAGPGGAIEIRLDTVDGARIGICPIPATGDWQTWRTQTCRLSRSTTGAHRVYLVYVGGRGSLFNLEWFAFQ